jgi:type II secretory pathway component PulF
MRCKAAFFSGPASWERIVLEWIAAFIDGVIGFFQQLGRADVSLNPAALNLYIFAGIILVSIWLAYRRWIRIRILSAVAWAVERNLPLDASLAALEAEAWNGFWGLRFLGWRRVVVDVRSRLQRGELFAGACRRWRRLFGAHRLCALAEAERAGRLGRALRATVRLLREEERARHDSKVALFYPIYMVGLLYGLIVILMGIMIWIMPQFQKIFDDLGEPALRCASLMAVSRILGQFGIHILLGLLVLVVLACWQRFYVAQRGWLFWIPGLGPLFRLGAARNSCEVASVLAGQGVPLKELLHGISEGVWYRPYQEMGRRWIGGVERGEDLAELVSRERLLPAASRELIALGVRSGDLEAGFRRAADGLASRIAFFRRVVTLLVGALLICLCGLLIGWFSVAIFGTLADLNMMMVP